MPATKKTPSSPVADVTRTIPWGTKLLLAVRAGGRCEFDGCNDYLFEHHVTLREGNFAQMAHIVAFKHGGPRGRAGARPRDIHAIDNLMLLCPPCHKEIDDNPDDFSPEALSGQKVDHEGRIRFLTDLRPDRKTVVLHFLANIRGQKTDLPFQDVVTAVSPRWPNSKAGHPIDLTGIHAKGSAFTEAAKQTIDYDVALLYQRGKEIEQIRHVSLFALGPIPLLAYLGSRLSDKIQVDLYQRHRDTGDWAWKSDGDVVGFTTRTVRKGSSPERVVLVLSLSGQIDTEALPASLDQSFTVYEITPLEMKPGTDFLRRRETLQNFRSQYRSFLATVVREHPRAQEIHVLPAVPAPVAVACGLDRLRDVQPRLIVYNNEGPNKRFVPTLVIGDDPN